LATALWVIARTERVATAPASVRMRKSTVIVGSGRTGVLRLRGDRNRLYKSAALQNMREITHRRATGS
jgi:hypothetical protein